MRHKTWPLSVTPKLNLLSRAKPTVSLKNRRKRAGLERRLPGNPHSPERMTFKRFAWYSTDDKLTMLQKSSGCKAIAR